jgi:glycosyltransferase involved in cell wall biosynthesis
MRIGLFAHELDPARATGIARYARGLASGLEPLISAGENELVVVTARDCGSVPQPQNVLNVRRRWLYLGWLVLSAPRLEWLVQGLDLVHVTSPTIPVATRLPLIVTVHDLMPLTHPQWYPAREVAMFKRCVRWLENNVDVVIVPTETVRRDVLGLTEISDDRIVVTGEGVDLDHFAEDTPSNVLERAGVAEGEYLLYLGQVSERKNLVPLVEAISESRWPLLVAGPEGHGAERVRNAAAEGAGDVRFLGRVSDADVGALVRGARALLHPSLYEGFGLTVVEAMAIGTPVVVSSFGALPEVTGDAGHVVTANDAEGWRSALVDLQDESLLDRLRTAGRVRAQEWNWPDAAAKTLEAYARLV